MQDNLITIINKYKKDELLEINSKSLAKVFCLLESITSELLSLVYGERRPTFPIDIREIIKKLDIEILEINLNLDIGFQLHHIDSYLTERKGKYRIVLDRKMGELVKRHILARQLGKYFFIMVKNYYGYSTKEELYSPYADPFFTKKVDELIYDVFASLIMFPTIPTLNYFEEYVAHLYEYKEVLDGYEWLRMLGQKADIAPYYTIQSYQYIKWNMCNLANNDNNVLVHKYKRFFK